ncbi:unnamed protein product [Eruca vesicaria subsp. sativa]|uniref:RING-type E3 ubiquitin transferase n=1 Tax=Eruca vesicaria subsp. sativa TaxID=29727 RepID=A0ABC8IYP0_ERUVS|nr:unnamed protein product [Eruca vesicaria subsp. sativa]
MDVEEAAVMEEIIYVALGRETAKNKSNLIWVIDNSQGNKICIVLVHQTPQMIPVLGTRFDAATVDEELVRAYREKQKAKTEKILDEYLTICLKKGVHAEKLCVETPDSIEKRLVQMITENKVRKFIMGAAADKHYSTYCIFGFTCFFLLFILKLTLVCSICRKMEELRSRKAIFVCHYAPPSCHIRFICKGHLIHTRDGRRDEVRALSALLYDFQRLVSSRSSSSSYMLSESSKGKSEVEEEEDEERTSRASSSQSDGTLSYSGGSEASSPSTTDEKSNHSSPPTTLPCGGMGLGMISFMIHSTKLWHKRAIKNHKQCE